MRSSPDCGAREIPLTRGFVAVVDEDDYERFARYKWMALVIPRPDREDLVYAVREAGPRTARTSILMHRSVLGAAADTVVDHVNGNGLDNRRVNLRLASKSLNAANANKPRRRRASTSKFKGVYFDSSRRRWSVRVQRRFVGRYLSEEEAARAYDRVARDVFGDFARLNFPD